MARRDEYPTEILDLTIESVNDKGIGFAIYQHPPINGPFGKQLKCFIPKTVPGDQVRLAVKNAKGRRRANLPYDTLLKAGPWRRCHDNLTPGERAGMPLYHMSDSGQLAYKTDLVKNAFLDNDLPIDRLQPIIGMAKPYRYRNNMELTFGSNGELGMHQQGNFKQIIDLEDSLLAPEIMIRVKKAISKWQARFGLSGYHKEKHTGLLRKLRLRYSQATNELMVALFANGEASEYATACEDLITHLTADFPELQSLLWLVDRNVSDVAIGEDLTVLFGRPYIHDELNGYHYRLAYDTFFQVNPTQATKLVKCALEQANLQGHERVIDLFCGIGTFSLPLAQGARELVGIELVENSIRQARKNAEENGIHNAEFIASDARASFEVLKGRGYPADLLLLNPPRSGAGGKLMRSIGRYGTSRLIYVSCSPKSLALDLRWLLAFGYQIKNIQPIDQFPHTVHVETVVSLEKIPQ